MEEIEKINDLKVGMYVRTKGGIIAKFVGFNEEWEDYEFDKGIYWFYEYYKDLLEKEELAELEIKYSYNIIDLIEVGDYVNGYYVSKIWFEGEITHYVDDKPIKRKDRCITIQMPSYGGIGHLYNKDIKSIVTKEQFKSMEYKIKE